MQSQRIFSFSFKFICLFCNVCKKKIIYLIWSVCILRPRPFSTVMVIQIYISTICGLIGLYQRFLWCWIILKWCGWIYYTSHWLDTVQSMWNAWAIQFRISRCDQYFNINNINAKNICAKFKFYNGVLYFAASFDFVM